MAVSVKGWQKEHLCALILAALAVPGFMPYSKYMLGLQWLPASAFGQKTEVAQRFTKDVDCHRKHTFYRMFRSVDHQDLVTE